jgi:hypothetical protein
VKYQRSTISVRAVRFGDGWSTRGAPWECGNVGGIPEMHFEGWRCRWNTRDAFVGGVEV